MRPTDVIKQKRRFEMFNDKSKEKVLELNTFFGKYIMHYEEKLKRFSLTTTHQIKIWKNLTLHYLKLTLGILLNLTWQPKKLM